MRILRRRGIVALVASCGVPAGSLRAQVSLIPPGGGTVNPYTNIASGCTDQVCDCGGLSDTCGHIAAGVPPLVIIVSHRCVVARIAQPTPQLSAIERTSVAALVNLPIRGATHRRSVLNLSLRFRSVSQESSL